MKKLLFVLQLFKNMGLRYVVYRVFHEICKIFGVLKKKHPIKPLKKQYISLEKWRTQEIPFVFDDRKSITTPKKASELLKNKAINIFEGKFQFFSNDWIDLGLNYDWLSNPDTGYKYDIEKHWSKINDFDKKNGDIKYVWEKSRFSYLITIIRYDYHFNEDNSKFVFEEIISWIKSNPINQGPNWKCSQEISLRLFNWLYALFFYKDSKHLTEEIFQEIIHVMYWKLHHIYNNIHFSRIAVRNNHAITETLALSLSELLFPFFSSTKKWSTKGKKYFEQEISYQIYDDGAFIQHSMNYHRVLIQLLTFGFAITKSKPNFFSELVYEKAYKALYFLTQFVQTQNGKVPNYGSNDGALFFPLSDSNFQDYRPSINSLHLLLTGVNIFNEREDFIFSNSGTIKKFEPIVIKQGYQFFKSGYFIYRDFRSFTFLRCASYKDRPAQADNLHLDIWVEGENVLYDGGTYKYNANSEMAKYFFGTSSHNAVMVNDCDQMLKGSRFIWYYWTQCKDIQIVENNEKIIIKVTISSFLFLNKKARHYRKLVLFKNELKWLVKDEILNLNNAKGKQIWHATDELEISSKDLFNKKKRFDSYQSNYYGSYKKNEGIYFEFKKSILSKIIYIENKTKK